jgi:hypothetical protein
VTWFEKHWHLKIRNGFQDTCGLLPWARDNYPSEVRKIQEKFPDDIISAPGYLRQNPVTVGDPYEIGNYVDEWGVCSKMCNEVLSVK